MPVSEPTFASPRVAFALACLWLAGCTALFSMSDTNGGVDAGIDSPATDAAADAPASDASPAGIRIPCQAPADCTGGIDCVCGFCVARDDGCSITQRTYVRSDGTRDCLPAAKKIDSAYAHTCAVLYDGNVYCWGQNDNGQVGAEPGPEPQPVPVRVAIPPAYDVSVGYGHSCAILEEGGVECWGANGMGQLGAGLDDERSATPLPVVTAGGAPLPVVSTVVTNGSHTCAIEDSEARSVWCWGDNTYSQVGIEAAANSPVAVSVFEGASALGAGGGMTCASTEGSGDVYCWGRDLHGALGRNRKVCSKSDSVTPYEGRVVEEKTGQFLDGVHILGLGNLFGCGVVTDVNEIWCWGQNAHHALGDQMILSGTGGPSGCGARRNVLLREPLVLEIVAGTDFACALFDDLGLYCWGSNEYGQLGTGDRLDSIPADPTLEDVTDAAAGFQHACAIRADGRVYCWGSALQGQLGDGTLDPHSLPVGVLPFCP